MIKRFLKHEQGQDLIEYSLLLAFIALAAIVLLAGMGSTFSGIWSSTNSMLQQANNAATPQQGETH